MRCTRRPRGIGLLEVVIAIALLVIVAAIAVPVARNQATARNVQGCARQLEGFLASARQSAIAKGSASVTFETRPNGFSAILSQNGQVVNRLDSPHNVILNLPAGLKQFDYARNGAASTGGTLTVTAVNQAQSQSLALFASTGAVVMLQPGQTVPANLAAATNPKADLAAVNVPEGARTFDTPLEPTQLAPPPGPAVPPVGPQPDPINITGLPGDEPIIAMMRTSVPIDARPEEFSSGGTAMDDGILLLESNGSPPMVFVPAMSDMVVPAPGPR